MDLKQISIYRMTHIDNIPHILLNGISKKGSQKADPNFITIGEVSLIDTRSDKNVIVDNGEVLSRKTQSITLGDFIPFYFGVRMPMLFVIQHGGNFVERPTRAEDIVYLACSLIHIYHSDLNFNFYFCDGHATNSYTTFYDKSKTNELPALIDWSAVKAPYWGGSGEDNLNVKRKKQAEFLVFEDLPANFIIGFGCYNDLAKKRLIKFGVESEKIKIIPGSYF